MTQIILEPPGPRWAPQIVVLLDDETRVLSVNKSLAGTSFDSISDVEQQRLHSQFHPACDGNCRFTKLWDKAWTGLESKDSVEWELEDQELGRLFRLNLSKTPEPRDADEEQREQHMLLTITDITKYRREYESLVEQQQALIRLLMAQRLESGSSSEQPFDEAGDTGNRLMAGYMKTERSLSRQLIQAQEKERERIASELHDGIAQSIGVVKYRIEDAVASFGRENPDLDLTILEATIDDMKGLVDEVRRISSNLSPSMLEDFGIHVALEWLCKEFKAQNRDIDVTCSVNIDEAETPELVKVAIYRVAQEALQNITKHSAATRVRTELKSTEGGVKLLISDNGVGFDKEDGQRGFDGKGGLGLRSMQERVDATGGEFQVKTAPQKGVEVRAFWAADDLEPNP
jgi:signal transduction histidine kinase